MQKIEQWNDNDCVLSIVIHCKKNSVYFTENIISEMLPMFPCNLYRGILLDWCRLSLNAREFLHVADRVFLLNLNRISLYEEHPHFTERTILLNRNSVPPYETENFCFTCKESHIIRMPVFCTRSDYFAITVFLVFSDQL